MRPAKRMLLRAFFIGEIVAFSYLYLFGPQGITAIMAQAHENNGLQERIKESRAQLAKLERSVQEWNDNSFLKERIAREQLQMARHNEQIYYLT